MKAQLVGGLLAIAFGLAALIGWVMNLFAIGGLMGGALSAELVIRLVGIFVAPLGSVMGLFF
jgi:hypothetical protein